MNNVEINYQINTVKIVNFFFFSRFIHTRTQDEQADMIGDIRDRLVNHD